MNTSENDFILCDFITEDGYSFQCKNCGVRVRSEEYQMTKPVFICRQPLKRTEDDLSFVTKLKNFAKATANHISNGLPMCTEDEIIHRHNICLSCEFFKDDTCSKCGCPLIRTKQFVSKLAWADQECPVGKWGKIQR